MNEETKKVIMVVSGGCALGKTPGVPVAWKLLLFQFEPNSHFFLVRVRHSTACIGTLDELLQALIHVPILLQRVLLLLSLPNDHAV